jgi:hypothetical protein
MMGYPIINPASPEADPALISGLVSWFKADAITGLSDGDPISTWPDSSGNGWNATQSGDQRPIWRETAGPNGLPTVEFDGTDDCLNIASGMAASWNAATGSTIFAVATINPALTGPQCVLAVGVNGAVASGPGRFFFNARGGVENRWRYGSRIGDDFADNHPRMVGGLANNTDSIVCAWHSCADREVRIYQDGGLKSINYGHGTGGNFASTNSGFRTLGAFDANGATELLDGTIAEVIVYNRPLTLSEIAGVTAYLRSKYAISAGTNEPPSKWGQADWPCIVIDPDELELSNNDPIASMPDISPMGMAWRQPTEASRPLYIASALNGAPAIRGDGSNDALESQDISTYSVHFQSIIAAGIGYLVVIAAVTRAAAATTAANRSVFSFSTGSATATLAFAGRRQTPDEWGGGGRREHTDTNTVLNSGETIDPDETGIYTTIFAWEDAELAFRKNGEEVFRDTFLTAGVTPNTNSALVTILRTTAGGTTHWGGDLYGLVAYRYLPSTREIAEAEAYFADRLGLDFQPWIDAGGSIRQGQTKEVTITGLGFSATSEVTLSGTGVAVDSVEYVDRHTLIVTMIADADAEIGTRDITVTNGVYAETLEDGLIVNAPSGNRSRDRFGDVRGQMARGAR